MVRIKYLLEVINLFRMHAQKRTVVDDDVGKAKFSLDLFKCFCHRLNLGNVQADNENTLETSFKRCVYVALPNGDFVSLLKKRFGNSSADTWTGAKYECDFGHDGFLGRSIEWINFVYFSSIT